MYQTSKNAYYPKSAVAGTNTVPAELFSEELKSYFNERDRSANKKPKGQNNASTNCPLNLKKDLNKLEECYWAKWKPSKTGGMCKPTTTPTKFMDFLATAPVTRFPYVPSGSSSNPCPNCQRLIQAQLMQKPKCQCCKTMMRRFSSTTESSEVRGPRDRYKLPIRNDETTDCECTCDYMTTAREGETTEFGYTEVGMAKDDYNACGKKRTADKGVGVGVTCDCGNKIDHDTRPLYVNKSCFTGSSGMLINGQEDEEPVRGPSRASSKIHPNSMWVSSDPDSYDDNTGVVEPIQYNPIQFDMEDEGTGPTPDHNKNDTIDPKDSPHDKGLTHHITPHDSPHRSNDLRLSLEKEILSSNDENLPDNHLLPGSISHENRISLDSEQFHDAKEYLTEQHAGMESQHTKKTMSSSHLQQIHPKLQSSLKNPPQVVKPTRLGDNPSGDCSCSPSNDPSLSACIHHTKEMVKHMKLLSEYIPSQAKSFVKEMAEIVSCEPVQDLKRQAERCLECALEAEAEAQRKYRMAQGKSRSREEKQANPSNTCGPIKEMKGSTSTKCCDDSPRVPNPADINESFLQQEQRLKREKEQLAVQEQLRKVQQEQTKHQLEEQRKLLEEQAREIQRQRDLQKKQALLQQQEQQLKVQAQAQSARIQQLDAASVRLKQQQELSKDTVSVLTPRVQEKQTVAKKPLLSAAVARVTGVLRHSYPLGRNGKKCGTKPVKPK